MAAVLVALTAQGPIISLSASFLVATAVFLRLLYQDRER